VKNCQQDIGNLIQKYKENKNEEEIEEHGRRSKPGIKEKQINEKKRGAGWRRIRGSR